MVETARILKSWRESLFSFEWLRPDGTIKPADQLPPGEQARRQAVEQKIRDGVSLEKPVLGIGMLDNVEIGAGRATFLTLAAEGVAAIPVHIPVSHTDEFKAFIEGAKPPSAKGGPKNSRQRPHNGESGNVVFYILMAVVVLAALVAAVARSGRETVNFLSSDKQHLLATEIMDYGDALVHATAQLRLHGTTFAQFSFASPNLPAGYGTYNSSPSHEIFNPAGGGINYRKPPAEALKLASDYAFVAANEVSQVGSSCGAAKCVDLMMVAGPLKPEVCGIIDSLLAVTASATDPPPAVSHIDAATPYAGTATYSATLGGTSGADPLNRKMAACVKDSGSGLYYYYQVLLPQ
jgi:hypothetical protein